MRNFWQDRTVFVTGATGLLGSWLVKNLLREGADITCLIRDRIPESELALSNAIYQVKTVYGDICDQALLERILAEYEIDTVFHLAAQTIVSVANSNPISTFESNIAGTWRLLEACRRSPKIKQIIVASSDKAYGDHDILPYAENAPLQGKHPYDVSKSCTDLIARSYAHTYGLPVVVTRCGNLYGGGDLNWNRIIPGTIRSIVRGNNPVIRSDGQFIRDYFYVEDGAYAYMHLAQCLAENRTLIGEAFNFSNGLQISVSELVNSLLTIMGSNLHAEILNQASNEIRNQYLCAEKARRLLGWEPKFTLEEGLERTISWYKDFLSSCHPEKTLCANKS